MSGPKTVGVIAIVLLSMSFAHRSEAADLTLAWDPPSDGRTVGFVIYYGITSGSYSQQVQVGAVTTYTVSGLAAGTTYYFAVRAYDAVADLSDFSAEVSAMTDSPSAMTGLALTPSLASPQVAGTTVTWSATPTGGVAPYLFQWSVYHAGQWTVGAWTSASAWTWTPNAAANDYFVRVAALSSGSTNPTGDMAQTAPFTVTTPAPCLGQDPFAAMGGGTCFNGGWYPPSGAPTTTPPPTPPAPSVPTGTTCMTPDPFTAMGGGTCFGGGWYPPGGAPAPVPTPAAQPAPLPSPVQTAAPAGATCTTPNPFTAFGMGVCMNGGWQFAAPATRPPAPRTTGVCATPDPFVGIPGLRGVCVNGGWYPVGG